MAAATNLVFLPWLRRGLGASIARADAPLPAGTAPVPVTTFGVTVHTTAGDATVQLPLVGPGDIAGLDPRVIVRTQPGKDESDAEFGHFAAMEFDQADLPWRYTPAAATTNGQLHPWFVLVVLEDSEWTAVAPTPSQKLAAATVASAASLPSLDVSWASAHVQLHGAAETATTGAALAAVFGGQPGLFVARMLCPRVLSQQTRYTAMLVPAYKRGVLAGLGTPPDNTVDALAPAWLATDTGITLPIYYQWSFQTGVVGSFRDLAKELTPQPVAATVGRRNIDVSVPGFDLANAAVTPTGTTPPVTAMPMEGALQSLQASQLPEPSTSTAWQSGFMSFVDTATTSVNGTTQPLVTPPLYGRWLAPETALAVTNRPWFFQLNIDPRERVSAGLGTLVVDERQQDLLTSAWNQVQGLLLANAERKILQLGREAFNRLFSRHIQSGSTDSLLATLGILQRWVLRPAGDITIHTAFAQSNVGRGVFDPQWRRLTRPRGPIGRRQLRHLPGKAPITPITRLAGGFQPAPSPPAKPSGAVSPAVIFQDVPPAGLTTTEVATLTARGADALTFWGILLFCTARKQFASGAGASWWWLKEIMRFSVGLMRLAAGNTTTGVRTGIRDGTLTAAQVSAAPGSSGFHAVTTIPSPIPTPPTPTGTDSADAAAFRTAFTAMLNAYAAPGIAPVLPTTIDIPSTVSALIAGLSPAVTLAASTLSRLKLDPSVTWSPADNLDPVQAAPSYSQPMWEPLRDESVDWILPGLDQVPTNTIGLVVSNQAFIEAYMVGLNHEMARTLLWNGFPTDQRGTYFRQFWDSRATPTSVGDLHDIKPITTWSASGPLGSNSPRPTPASLVLLVRGDLIRRYPNTVVYSVPGNAPTAPGAPETMPLFAGLLTGDVSFYGFPFTPPQAVGSPGVAFVLQEQPAEPRFAGPVATTPVNPTGPVFVLPTAVSATTAAQYASVTYQQPVRVVIPASLLVPAS
jgi:hypothetical protein